MECSKASATPMTNEKTVKLTRIDKIDTNPAASSASPQKHVSITNSDICTK